MNFFDYDRADIYFDKTNFKDFNNSDIEKKLIASVNSINIMKASKIAEKLLYNDIKNQEAWLVYLIYSKMNNLKKPFDKFITIKEKEKLELINYIFYTSDDELKNNKDISATIYEIVNSSSENDNNDFQNYNYFIFYLNLSLVLDNNNDEANYFLGILYERLKKYQKAEEYFNKIKDNQILYIESQKKIATNIKFYKSINESEKYFIKLLNIYPDNISLYLGLADLYRTSEEYKKAISYYSQAINKNIEKDLEWQILYYRGICYERINNWELAEKDFIDSLDINWESPQVLNYLAYGWIERDIFLDKSLEMLIIAHDKYPESHYILDSLAWAHYKKNNFEIASKLMEEVTLRAPGEVISLDHLGDIYFALGRKREAYYMWKQAYDLAKPEDDIIHSLKIKIEKYNAG